MAKEGFTPKEREIVRDALETYKDEVKKVLKKAEKLGLPQAGQVKQHFLEVEALRDKITNNG